ncbi:hypothetical protein CFOL_v3_16160 [Cephalotus follicularis]|uniref:Thionin-like protein 2 n=1 Tax=Cephalotus follicularis TaxID=3775 RepID=A0A1Q3BXQ4_CEPFO|nr:hypothetical protein CFOL_v3_16160 [Cephalotus follicularis]
MEEKRVKSLLMVCLVLGLLVGQSAADFQTCFTTNFIKCITKDLSNVIPSAIPCAIQSLSACIFPSSPSPPTSTSPANILSTTQNFCKLRCAIRKCTHLSTKEDPGAEKVEACVNSCSKKCSKN